MAIRHSILGISLLAMGAMGLSSAINAQGKTAKAELLTETGQLAGTATLTGMAAGVLIDVSLRNLGPGAHAIHIHETGACIPDFSAAGGHINPENKVHGYASFGGPHAGDLPNVFVGQDGTARAHFLNARISMEFGAGLVDADGAAIIVHEKADSYEQDADVGGRIACGIIDFEN